MTRKIFPAARSLCQLLSNPGRKRKPYANLANFEQWNFSCGARLPAISADGGFYT
jgi:hypothetical protein